MFPSTQNRHSEGTVPKVDSAVPLLNPKYARRRALDSNTSRVRFPDPSKELSETQADEKDSASIVPRRPQNLVLEEQRHELVRMRVKLEARREVLMQRWSEEQRRPKDEAKKEGALRVVAMQMLNLPRRPPNNRPKMYFGPAA